MRLKPMFAFEAKVIEPCNKLLSKFKLKFQKNSISLKSPTFRRPRRHFRPKLIRPRGVRFRKPFSIRAPSFPQCRPKTKFKNSLRFRRKKPPAAKKPVRIAQLLTVLFTLRKTKEVEIDQITPEVTKEPFTSPITPGFVRNTESKKDSGSEEEEEEDVNNGVVENHGGKSFEDYLVEMIVEDGKLNDLIDVEEILYCWRNLTCPVFIDLVSRFYGELGFFSPSEEDA